jgi:hypothetical protein
MAANTTPAGNPRSNLCKLCVTEQVKLLLRNQRFPAFLTAAAKWPRPKLLSEIAWLDRKLTALRAIAKLPPSPNRN